MAKFKKIELDKQNGIVTLGAGQRLKPVYRALEGSGFGFVGGTSPTVGISGYLLGGGHSLLSRQYGVGSDSLLEVTLVTSNGTILTVNDRQHSDLFWAIRGGGNGNFGIAVVRRHTSCIKNLIFVIGIQGKSSPNGKERESPWDNELLIRLKRKYKARFPSIQPILQEHAATDGISHALHSRFPKYALFLE